MNNNDDLIEQLGNDNEVNEAIGLLVEKGVKPSVYAEMYGNYVYYGANS